LGQVDDSRVLRDFLLRARRNCRDELVFDKQQRVADFFVWRVETMSAEDDHIAATSVRASGPLPV
jgi:hypothetical protein